MCNWQLNIGNKELSACDCNKKDKHHEGMFVSNLWPFLLRCNWAWRAMGLPVCLLIVSPNFTIFLIDELIFKLKSDSWINGINLSRKVDMQYYFPYLDLYSLSNEINDQLDLMIKQSLFMLFNFYRFLFLNFNCSSVAVFLIFFFNFPGVKYPAMNLHVHSFLQICWV